MFDLKIFSKSVKLIRTIMHDEKMLKYALHPNIYARFELTPGVGANNINDLKEYIKIGHHLVIIWPVRLKWVKNLILWLWLILN